MVKGKYRVKQGYESAQIVAKYPPERKNGLYILGQCTQKELKYLHDIVGYSAVIFEPNDEKDETQEQIEGEYPEQD